jgi:hypothetical protein
MEAHVANPSIDFTLIVPQQFRDPPDALSHGLLIALKKCSGRGQLATYVSRCAYLCSLQQVK